MIPHIKKGMKPFVITYKRNDMPKNYTGKSIKWSHNEKDAVKLLLSKAPDKDGYCLFKKGGQGKILSVKEL
jgi:hypothetical protein